MEIFSIKNQMMSQMDAYFKQISSADPAFRISRSQSTSVKNELLARIVSDLNSIGMNDSASINNPIDLKYAKLEEDAINVTELLSFLDQKMEILLGVQNDRESLDKFVDDLNHEIHELFGLTP